MKKLIPIILLLAFSAIAFAQVPVSLMPDPCPPFLDANSNPLAGGKVFTYAAGTTTPQATYTDATGTVQNANPIILDSGGFPRASQSSSCGIWLSLNSYRIVVQNSTGVQQWVVDNVSDPGFFYTVRAVLLNPTGGVLQTITGPLAATHFEGTVLHVTSTGIRVSYLDPVTQLDTATNPPKLTTYNPALSGQNYNVPDPGVQQSAFVLNPGSADWAAMTTYPANTILTPNITTNPCGFSFITTAGLTSGSVRPTFSTLPCAASPSPITDNGGNWASQGLVNALDCTKTGLTCKRTAYFYLEGAGCNNTAPLLGWDTFGSNSPTPFCVTGANTQKGVMAFPAAATKIQENIGSAGAGTVTTTYPKATAQGDLLEAEIVVDTSRTVSGCTDGTNAYTKATSVTNGTLDFEIWYFNGNSSPMPAATVLTCTLSAAGNAAIDWKEYSGILTAAMLDRTATNTGSGTAVTTGTTLGTSQNVELVISAFGSAGNPSIAFQNGWSPHSSSYQVSNVVTSSQGLIQQATTTQAGSFTLGTSQVWAAAIATFKVSVAGAATAQRQVALPGYFLPATPVNAAIKWQTPQLVIGTATVSLGAAIACTTDGFTDDPAFNAATTVTPAVSPTGPVITTTQLSGLNSSGCAASNLLHYQIQRNRYAAADTFEGWVYVDGSSLQFGITQ